MKQTTSRRPLGNPMLHPGSLPGISTILQTAPRAVLLLYTPLTFIHICDNVQPGPSPTPGQHMRNRIPIFVFALAFAASGFALRVENLTKDAPMIRAAQLASGIDSDHLDQRYCAYSITTLEETADLRNQAQKAGTIILCDVNGKIPDNPINRLRIAEAKTLVLNQYPDFK
ncbi:MAG: hypothetical protein JWL80_475 [Parcubacteria group bacterium]|nr:hypothetical protein [Parcubacteria group bacterium]